MSDWDETPAEIAPASGAPVTGARLDESFRRHRLLRGGVTVMLGTILQKAFGLAYMVVFARELTRWNFDAFVFAVGFGVFFETFSDFGLDFVLSRELNQRDESEHGRIVGTAMVTKTVTFAITFGLAAIAAMVKPEYRAAALVATVGMFCGIPGTISIALRARMRTAGPEIISTISSLVNAVALIVAVTRGASPLALVTTLLVSRAASTLLLVLLWRQLPFKLAFDRALVRPLLRGALPVALSTAAVIVYTRSDQLVLGVVGEVGQLGGYAVAVRMVDALNFIPMAIGVIALPTFSHLEGYDEARFRRLSERATRYLALVILPLAVLATVAGGALLAVLFGERFRDEGTTLAVLVWAHFFAASWVLARPILIARHRASYLSLLAIVAAVVNVTLNLFLIPRFGGVGAAWASLVSYASPFALAAFLPVLRESFTVPLRAAVRPLVAAAILLAVLSPLPGNAAAKLALFAVAAPATLLLTRSVTAGEVRDMVGSAVRGR